VSVAEGLADSKQLAAAEQAVHFAETRLGAAEEARRSKLRKDDAHRAGEIVDELAKLDPVIAEAMKLEDAIGELIVKLQPLARQIEAEVHQKYADLSIIDERNKSALTEAGVNVSRSVTAIRVGNQHYVPRTVQQILANLLRGEK
jgi:hypothetical protein